MTLRLKPPFRGLLHNKNLMLLFISQLCSNITANTILFTLMNFVFEYSQSTIAVGILVFFYFLPSPILGIFSGTIVDRSNKRKVLIFSNLIQAFVVLSFFVISHHPLSAYLLIFLYSLFDEFFNPAVGAIIPNIVKKENLGSANTIWLFASQGSWVIGALVAGSLLKFLPNANLIFPIASGLLLLGSLASYYIPEKLTDKGIRKKAINLHFDFIEFWEDVQSGYYFVRQKRIILFPIVSLAGAQMVISTATIALPAFSKLLNVPFADASFLFITPTVLGALFGSWKISQEIKEARHRKKDLIFGGTTAVGIATIVLVIATLFHLPVTLISLFLFALGFAFVFIVVPMQTLIQENTPLHIRGRVYGILGALIAVTSFFPSLIAISLIELIGLRLILLLSAIFFLLLSHLSRKNQEKLFASLNHYHKPSYPVTIIKK